MKINFEITRQDYGDFNKFHFVKTSLKKTIIIALCTIILLQILVNRNKFNLSATIISSIFFAFIYFFFIMRILSRAKNIPDNDGAILGSKEMEFGEDKITFKTKNSEGHSDWTSVKKLEESDKSFYLYMESHMAILVPKRAFNNKQEEEGFRNLVNRKIKPILL